MELIPKATVLGDLTCQFPELSCMSKVQGWDLPACEIYQGRHHVETKGSKEKNKRTDGSVPMKIRIA